MWFSSDGSSSAPKDGKEGEIIDLELTWHLCNFAMRKNKFTTHFYGERRGYGVWGRNIILYIWPLSSPLPPSLFIQTWDFNMMNFILMRKVYELVRWHSFNFHVMSPRWKCLCCVPHPQIKLLFSVTYSLSSYQYLYSRTIGKYLHMYWLYGGS